MDSPSFREIFGQKLRELRKSRNLTQRNLGEIIGLSTNAISLYETGKHEPLFEHLVKISQFFNVSIEYLLNLDEDEQPDAYDAVIYLAKENDISPETLKNLINEISKYKGSAKTP